MHAYHWWTFLEYFFFHRFYAHFVQREQHVAVAMHPKTITFGLFAPFVCITKTLDQITREWSDRTQSICWHIWPLISDMWRTHPTCTRKNIFAWNVRQPRDRSERREISSFASEWICFFLIDGRQRSWAVIIITCYRYLIISD